MKNICLSLCLAFAILPPAFSAGGACCTYIMPPGTTICCPAPPIEIPPAAFADPDNPTEAEWNAWISANHSAAPIGQKFYIPGAGTAKDPEWTFEACGDGSAINDESPSLEHVSATGSTREEAEALIPNPEQGDIVCVADAGGGCAEIGIWTCGAWKYISQGKPNPIAKIGSVVLDMPAETTSLQSESIPALDGRTIVSWEWQIDTKTTSATATGETVPSQTLPTDWQHGFVITLTVTDSCGLTDTITKEHQAIDLYGRTLLVSKAGNDALAAVSYRDTNEGRAFSQECHFLTISAAVASAVAGGCTRDNRYVVEVQDGEFNETGSIVADGIDLKLHGSRVELTAAANQFRVDEMSVRAWGPGKLVDRNTVYGFFQVGETSYLELHGLTIFGDAFGSQNRKGNSALGFFGATFLCVDVEFLGGNLSLCGGGGNGKLENCTFDQGTYHTKQKFNGIERDVNCEYYNCRWYNGNFNNDGNTGFKALMAFADSPNLLTSESQIVIDNCRFETDSPGVKIFTFSSANNWRLYVKATRFWSATGFDWGNSGVCPIEFCEGTVSNVPHDAQTATAAGTMHVDPARTLPRPRLVYEQQ